MHTVWVRLNAVVFFGLSVLLGLSLLAALSKLAHAPKPGTCVYVYDTWNMSVGGVQTFNHPTPYYVFVTM